MNTIFKPKLFIKSLSSKRINKKPILYLLLVFILILIWTAIMSFFGIGQEILKDGLLLFQKSLEPLNDINGTEKLSIISKLIRDLFLLFLIMFLIFITLIVLLNWIVKKTLSFFKKEISLYKLLNITIYSALFTWFLVLALAIIFGSLYPLLINLSVNYLITFLFILKITLYLSPYVMFVYGVKISIIN